VFVGSWSALVERRAQQIDPVGLGLPQLLSIRPTVKQLEHSRFLPVGMRRGAKPGADVERFAYVPVIPNPQPINTGSHPRNEARAARLPVLDEV
jgi:hypothetical protein